MQQLFIGGRGGENKIKLKRKQTENPDLKKENQSHQNPCVKMYITHMRDFRSRYDLNMFRTKWFHLSKNNLFELKGILIESKSLHPRH